MFRPDPVVQRIPLGGTWVCVVDDALLAPERWVEDAAAHAGGFAEAPRNAYPGLELRMPDAVSARIGEYFDRHLRGHYGIRRTLRQHAKLALVTRQPAQLQPYQTIPHVDALACDAGECAMAAVLYLFRDPALGGTNFYRPRVPPARLASLVADAGALDGPAFAARHGVPRAYPGDGGDWFERVLQVPARWNRLLVYPGTMLHSGAIGAPDHLHADPRRGRLTLNAFLTCRRALDA